LLCLLVAAACCRPLAAQAPEVAAQPSEGVAQPGAPAAAPAALVAALQQEPLEQLALAARREGDVLRGAIAFHQPYLACTRCHRTVDRPPLLAPNLARLAPDTTDVHLVESLLWPSRRIARGFEAVQVITTDGRVLTGLVVQDTPDALLLQEVGGENALVRLSADEIAERAPSSLSLMPAEQIGMLGSRQQFLDLVRYLMELRDGGPARAGSLVPPPWLLAQIPEYESHVDHAGLISAWNAESLARGEAIYTRVCASCHGSPAREGSLPTALRFAEGRFKNGSDPYSIYQTLTRGFGLMAPQSWMVPQQKYDVIHYLREAYLKPHNPAQYVSVDADYLARLPRGDTLGPPPADLAPWTTMDYGPNLIHTYQLGFVSAAPSTGQQAEPVPAERDDLPHIAYKGIAIRLDHGPGGVARGTAWVVFDHDTLRIAGGWHADEGPARFIDFQGIQFDGQHGVHPRIVGRLSWYTPPGPGWADPDSGSFEDPRLLGRDGRHYGPLPRSWARYRGLYHHGLDVVLEYTVGDCLIRELPQLVADNSPPVFARWLWAGPADRELVAAVAVADAPAVLVCGEGCQLGVQAGRRVVRIPPHDGPLLVGILLGGSQQSLRQAAQKVTPPADFDKLLHGGPPRWPELLTTSVQFGADDGPFAVDVLNVPQDNPWLCRLRCTGLDFHADGDRMAICTWDGDVWEVSGLRGLDPTAPGSAAGFDKQGGPQSEADNNAPALAESDRPRAASQRHAPGPLLPAEQAQGLTHSGPARLIWRRIASGLFQPLGLKIIDDRVYLACRDQIVRLHDLNGDGETDWYECFNNDHQVTEHFHEFAMGLQADAQGNLYYAKSARHALPAVVPQHGTLLRVSADGSQTEILATGFRAANGVCLNADGTFFVTDQEGHWVPKNRINWVRPGRFYGNLLGYHNVQDTSDDAMEPPLCWITNTFDRSPAELLWVTSKAWGPLDGSLLNLSYGHGQVYVVAHECVPHPRLGQCMQGGMALLPLWPFPTGVMRGRFHPSDGQLYVCGMYAWAGNQQQPGGVYRIRYTGKPLYVPLAVQARRGRLLLRFSAPLDAAAACRPENYQVRTWALRRTANYGSAHYDERELNVAAARLEADGQSLVLEIPDLAPAWCLETRYDLKGRDGQPFRGSLHHTIHVLPD
jgi:putative heme-binding domain-containing protein